MWAPEELEDEPCDKCGIKPSRHDGHGTYICKPCFDVMWCPKCNNKLERFYSASMETPHACLPLAERRRFEKETNDFMKTYAAVFNTEA